jgi:hypothetical protein
MTRIFCIVVTTILWLSCGQKKSKKDNETTKTGNIYTTISTDTSKLSKIIDINIFKPTKAKFKYIFIDNSGQNERLPVPGPSDNYLEAVLYFDTVTFKTLKTKYFSENYHSPNLDKRNFNFEWLDKDIKIELMKSDANYQGHPDFFLGLGQLGKLWLLENKLLLTKSTN